MRVNIDYTNYGNTSPEEYLSRKKLLAPHHRAVLEKFLDFFQNINPLNKRVLDIGCGDGVWLDILRNLGFDDIAGIDLSEAMLKRAKTKGHKVEKKSLYDLNDVENKYDIVIMMDVLEHLPELDKAVQIVYNLLNPKGLFYINTIVCDSMVMRLKRFFYRENRLRQSQLYDSTHLYGFTKKQVEALLYRHHFSILTSVRLGNTSYQLGKRFPKLNRILSKLTIFGLFGDLLTVVGQKENQQ